MKKFVLTAMGVVAMMSSLASCSNEEPMPVPGNPNAGTIPSVVTGGELQTVTFTGNMPRGVHARSWAVNDVTELVCGIFDTEGTLVIEKTYSGTELAEIKSADKFSVKFNLAKNGKYRAFFWAHRGGEGFYEISLSRHKVDIADHLIIFDNDAIREAWMYDDPTVISPAEQTSYDIILKRPFAHVRLASNQMEDPAVKNLYRSGVTVIFGAAGTERWERKLPTSYDFWTGKTVDSSYDLLDLTDWMPSASLNNVIDGYQTLFDHYFFVNREGSTIDASFALDDTHACDYQTQEGGGQYFKSVAVGQTLYKQNCRYTYLDNGGEGGEGGGIFGSQTSFTVTVDDDFDNSSDTTL